MYSQEEKGYDFRSTEVQVPQAPAVLQLEDSPSTHTIAALEA
jgi:hypothetical protein